MTESALGMTEAAPGKVNLCLFLGPLRDDGRHELVTVFESVSLFDELALAVLDAGAADEVVCPGVEGPNLVGGALAALRDRGWDAPPVRIEISKRIPVAAGMAGGSADAAAALRLAARLAPVEAGAVESIAAALGSDVPSQLQPGVALGTGAGDLVEPLAPLEPHAFVIVPQPFALSTADVYREADRLGLGRTPAELGSLRAAWRNHIGVNDLQAASRSLRPAIDDALSAIRATSADATFMCGSGPTCAGLWWGDDAAHLAGDAADSLAARFSDAVSVVPVTGIGHNSTRA